MEVILNHQNSRQVQELYRNYGGMLYGYIFEVVNDNKLAELYLLRVFKSLSKEIEGKTSKEINNWAQVFKYTKYQLSIFNQTANSTTAPISETIKSKELHPTLSHLDDEQRKIFCDSYYYGKTIEEISIELNQPEALIRKTLRQAFILIRTGSGN